MSSQIDGRANGLSPKLKVAVGDPDGDRLDVTFFGRESEDPGDVAPEDFTLMVVPHPQRYVLTEASFATHRAQMRWIGRSREAIGTAFVVAVGDLVQHVDSAAQWARADAAWRLLDDAGVPYAVVPGNHDMSRVGRAELYDRLFSPGRFGTAPWYGGYMGDPTTP